MNIAYRRVSGAIGLTHQEIGARGLWWEKRRALVAALRARGHRVDFISRYTKATAKAYPEPIRLNRAHHLLVIEFGSSNKVFYGKDLEATAITIAMHRGPVVFLCDDPDLPFPWRDYGLDRDWSRWTVWANATRGSQMGGPGQLTYRDMPFAALMEPKRPKDEYGTQAVYLGRPLGRIKAVKSILAAQPPIDWRVHGKQAEWDKAGFAQVAVQPPPGQPQRAEFYSDQRASLVLADARHKRLGWRTGRAYHAILAGCPAIVEHDHDVMAAFHAFEGPGAINAHLEKWADARTRALAWERQYESVAQERQIAVATFEAAGL